MAHGQKEPVSEQGSGGRGSWYLFIASGSHHPRPTSGTSGAGAEGSRRPKEGRISQQAQLWPRCPGKWMLLFIVWAVCGPSLQDPCKITTTKTLLSLLSPWTTYFLSFSLKSGDAWYVHALRKQDYSAHPTILGSLHSEMWPQARPHCRNLLLRVLAELLHKTFKSRLAGFTLEHLPGCLLTVGLGALSSRRTHVTQPAIRLKL